MKETTKKIYDDLFLDYPVLSCISESIAVAFDLMRETYASGGKLLIGGNGGSACDSEHIVGELLKSFKKKRAISDELKSRLDKCGEDGEYLISKLEGALPAISLISHTGLITAFANDKAWDATLAQETVGLGRAGDTLVLLSTSGNSRNCVLAAKVATSMGIKTVAFTGKSGGELGRICDAAIAVPECETYRVQELHLPVYHALCAMLEEEFF